MRGVLLACGLLLVAACGGDATAPATPTEPATPLPSAVAPSPTVAPTVVVELSPADDVGVAMAGQQAGTEYRLAAGLYREFSVEPRDGDQFIGEAGTVLSGARVLEGFERDGDRWVIGGQTQQLFASGVCADPETLPALSELGDYDACVHPEQLFLDGEPLWQVDAIGDLTAGRWFFDYANDRIYLADDPAGRQVETSVVERAFGGGADDVLIRGLTVEMYANRAQTGAIDAGDGARWILDELVVRLNHGTGIRIGDELSLTNSVIESNGQLGVGGIGDRAVIESNEIASNNTAGFMDGWEGGGTKFVATRDLVVRNNHVHHNVGRGLWTDIDNIGSLIEGNLVEWNTGAGIVHEISFAAEIRNNESRHNGLSFDVQLWGAQILVQNSSDVVVRDNVVIVPAEGGDGIGVVEQSRGDGPLGVYLSRDVVVTGNEITYLGTRGNSGFAGNCDAMESVSFDGNTYRASTEYLELTRFEWCGLLTWEQFLEAGQEATGIAATGESAARRAREPFASVA